MDVPRARIAALLTIVVVALAGCTRGEEALSAEDVHNAFEREGFTLSESAADGYVNLVPYDPVPTRTAAELPAFYIGVFDDAEEARRVERGDGEWDVVVVTLSAGNDPLATSGPREPLERRLRRLRNVVVEYDPSDRRLVRRIAAALRALEERSG